MSSIFLFPFLEMRDLRLREGTGQSLGNRMHNGQARGQAGLNQNPDSHPLSAGTLERHTLLLNLFPQLENGLQGCGGWNNERCAKSTEHGQVSLMTGRMVVPVYTAFSRTQQKIPCEWDETQKNKILTELQGLLILLMAPSPGLSHHSVGMWAPMHILGGSDVIVAVALQGGLRETTCPTCVQ